MIDEQRRKNIAYLERKEKRLEALIMTGRVNSQDVSFEQNELQKVIAKLEKYFK